MATTCGRQLQQQLPLATVAVEAIKNAAAAISY
jgi:hypothetical protein